MKKLIPVCITTLLFIAGTLICFVNKDNFIMYYGIRSYRTISSLLIGCSSVGMVGTLSIGAVTMVKNRQRLNEIVINQQALEEKQRALEEKSAGLSIKREIDPDYIVKCLKEQKAVWNGLGSDLDECIGQFDQMNEYQARFSKLLKDNEAKTLSDTEDVLEQVEQYMCKNARNVINFMNVADDDAFEQIKERLNTCRQENQNLLNQTRDFIYAMADFLNDQGGKADTRLLESYKDTLLSTIHKDSVL